MELPFGWSFTNLIVNLIILAAEVVLAVVAWRYVRKRTRRETVWLEFLRRSLIRGMKYPEIEYLKPLYMDLLAHGREATILNPLEFRAPLLRFLTSRPKSRVDIRLDVRIFRGLGFEKHSDELVGREGLDEMDPVSLEPMQGGGAVFGLIGPIRESGLDVRVTGDMPTEFASGEKIQMYFYRPASGAFLLPGLIERVANQLISIRTNFQFVHADERHFMAELRMKGTLCVNMVPLIRVMQLPVQGQPSEKEAVASPGGSHLPGMHRRIQWKQLDRELGIYPVETARVSDRAAVLLIEDSALPRMNRNFLNQAYMLTLDFVDGQPLEITGHIMSIGRKKHFLFRFGEMSPGAHHRLNRAIRESNPEREQLV